MELISFDFETFLISADTPAPKPVCLSWAQGDKSGILIGSDMEPYLKAALNSDATLIAHNLKFEALVIHEWFPALREALWKAYDDKRLHCTMVNEKIINNFANKQIQHRFDLATLVKKYKDIDITAGKKDPDAWRLRYAELDGVPLAEWPQEAIDYSIQDSIYTLDIFHAQEEHLEHLSYKSTRADFVLGLAANRGMTVETGRVLLLKEEILAKLKPSYVFLEEKGFGAISELTGKFKKNMKVFKEYLSENTSNVKTTVSGAVSTSSESLSNYTPNEDASEDYAEVLSTFLNLAVYEKILSAFVPALEAATKLDNPIIRTNYNPVVSTGRTSSSGSKLYPSANIQQMPRALKGVTHDVRGCYKAREGFKLVSIDYGGLELCTTAHQLNEVYGKSAMKEYLNEGNAPTDLHSRFASQVMTMETGKTVSYEEFLKRKKEPEFAKYRQICKALNLGFPGGIGYEVMGSQLFKDGVNIPKTTLKGPDGKPLMAFTDKQASYYMNVGRKTNPNIRTKRISKFVWIFIIDELVGLKQRYYEMYPEIKEFLTETHNFFLTGETKMVKNEFGEWEKEPLYKFNVSEIKRDNAMYTQFCNGFLMQSPSAQGAKQMLWEVGHEFRNSKDVYLDAFIHDEIVIEVRDDNNFANHIDKVASIMLSSMQKVLPSVRINVEAAAMTYWSKDGDGTFDRLYWMDPKSKELKYE